MSDSRYGRQCCRVWVRGKMRGAGERWVWNGDDESIAI